TEIAVEAGDTRRRLVAPACILELLGGKIERPCLIRDALAVRIHDDRDRPLRRSLRNIVLDQLAHASIARGIRGPTEDHRDDVFLIAADRSYQVVSGSLGITGLDPVDALHLSEQGVVIVHLGALIVKARSCKILVVAGKAVLNGTAENGLVA